MYEIHIIYIFHRASIWHSISTHRIEIREIKADRQQLSPKSFAPKNKYQLHFSFRDFMFLGPYQ